MEETLTAHNADCALTVTVTYQPEGPLRLLYKAHNHSTLPIYLCNQLYELEDTAGFNEPAIQLHPDLVHIEVEPLGVRLTKAIVDLSFHDGIRALDIPYLSEVLPNHTLEQSFSVALPLQPYRVYGQRPGQAPAIPLLMSFALGYFNGTPELTASLTPVLADVAGTYELAPFQSRNQALITVGPFVTPLPVANATPSTTPAPPVAPAQWTPWS